MSKKVIAILFGGQSSEHEISKISVSTIIQNINQDKYTIIPIYITKEGHWLLYDGPLENMTNGNWEKFASTAVLSPDTKQKGLLRIVGDKVKHMPVDVVFPVLHGANGEDGTIQGLLELAKMPYVGCGVLSSAMSMNKAYTKIVVESLGIEQAKHTVVQKYELEASVDTCIKKIEEACKYPVFIKPACAGSSLGITKASNQTELVEGLWIAAKEHKTIVIEQGIDAIEVECAVIGNKEVRASVTGQAVAASDFYDFDAKYNNAESKTIIPAPIAPELSKEIQEKSIQIFKALDCMGLSRVDFFIEKGSNKVIFNEINTLPGFTSISMYTMLFNESGVTTEDLIEELIELGLSRYED